MPMMPLMGVRISWLILARNSLLARLPASAASLAKYQLLIEGEQLGGASRDLGFQVVAVLLQSLVPRLDFFQHLVEGCNELAYFVAAAGEGAQAVILVAGDDGGGAHQFDDGLGDQSLQAGGKERGQPQGSGDNGGDNRQITVAAAGEFLQIRFDENDAQGFAGKRDGMKLQQAVGGEITALRPKRLASSGIAGQTRVAGKLATVAGEYASGLDVRFGAQGGEHVVGGIGVVEGERSRAVLAHDGGNDVQVAGHATPEVEQVVGAHRQAGQQQGRAAGGHDKKSELAAQRNVAEAAHQFAPPPTLTTRATARSLELSLRW